MSESSNRTELIKEIQSRIQALLTSDEITEERKVIIASQVLELVEKGEKVTVVGVN